MKDYRSKAGEQKTSRYLTLQQAAVIAKFPKLSVRVTRMNVFVYREFLQTAPELTIPRVDSAYIIGDRRCHSLQEALTWAHIQIHGSAPTPNKSYR